MFIITGGRLHQGRAIRNTLCTAYPNSHAYSAYPVWAPVYSRNTQPLCIKRRIGIRAKCVYPARPKVRFLANTCENTQCCILLHPAFLFRSNFPINHQHPHTARPLAPGAPPPFPPPPPPPPPLILLPVFVWPDSPIIVHDSPSIP